MLYYARGSKTDIITAEETRAILKEVFDGMGPKKRVMAIPPDFTRLNSFAGPITEMAYDYYGDALTDVMPALGTHTAMTEEQISVMFGHVPADRFRVHDWRNDVVTLGTVPGSYVSEVSGGRVDFSLDAQVNKLLLDPSFDLILSIGQVVPHEVIGMANYTKNIFVGVGGSEFINKSHFIGAAYGMERIMGRAKSPVRDVFEYAKVNFASQLPIVYVLTVRAKDAQTGQMVTRGLFIGDDFECFQKAADLSLETNFIMLDREIHKCIVYLDPEEFKSTWLGNKSVYRTRMALADDAELIVLAPALREFGEDKTIDGLIRRYGYKGTPHTLECTEANKELQDNLGATAHLIHGSSEGRFTITYCPGEGMSREEIEGVGYKWCSYEDMVARYPVDTLKDGWNTMPDGEEIYYISNPALGLWAYPERFKDKMKIVCDNKIPFLKGVLEPYAEVVYLPGAKTTPEDVRDADAIITRTRTACREPLLAGSKVKVIATATIGFDHIDTAWCEANGIIWKNCPGCNSWSVKQYLASVLVTLAKNRGLDLGSMTLGVVGVGNVGSKVAEVASLLGMKVLLNDPPRARKEGEAAFVSLDEVIRRSDIITVHVPLIREGEDKTLHLFDEKLIGTLGKNQILINSSRGPVVDNKALKAALQTGAIGGAVLDVWEGEPDLDPELVNLLDLSTPHIAGYSADGKANGTWMSVHTVSEVLDLPLKDWKVSDIPAPQQSLEFSIDATGKDLQTVLAEAILHTYEVTEDSDRLRASLGSFEALRGDYQIRREFTAFTVKLTGATEEMTSRLSAIGFNIG